VAVLSLAATQSTARSNNHENPFSLFNHCSCRPDHSDALSAYGAEDDLGAIKSEITKLHDESVKRLQDWIGQVSIAAENRGYPEGAEYMAKLARDAGFQEATVINTDGKPSVFATLDAGAPNTVGLYFMYDVKQFDPAEWSSPPTEARIVDKPPLGKAMIGRGAVNQKGPEAAFFAALHAIRGAGKKMPVNLVMVAEGEEDILDSVTAAARTRRTSITSSNLRTRKSRDSTAR
jgi:acetylornithine deacetylase/succinyl-diaminopimelate desuccinylase-like protein